MKRTRFLSLFILVLLSLDLVLGIINVYSDKFLDTNGDSFNAITITQDLFGRDRTCKAINTIAQERMLTHDAVIKKFANFAFYTDDYVARQLLNKYINKVNKEIVVYEFNIDNQEIEKFINTISQNDRVSIKAKRKYITSQNTKKFKVYLIPHQYSDSIFDESLTREMILYNRCTIMLLKYLDSNILDEIHTKGILQSHATNQTKYSYGDLVSLHRSIRNICFIGQNNRDSNMVINTSAYLHHLLLYNNRIMLYGSNNSYILSVYPTGFKRTRIERKHTASDPVYCFIANKWITKFDIHTRFTEQHKNHINKFAEIGNLVYIGKFINKNMISNILSSTTLENDKLNNILQCMDMEFINKNDSSFIMLTQFGAMYFEKIELTEREVQNSYMEVSSIQHAMHATNKYTSKSHTVRYTIPPFMPMFEHIFKLQFGLDYKYEGENKFFILLDYHNKKFWHVHIRSKNIIDKVLYPSYSLVNMIISELKSQE